MTAYLNDAAQIGGAAVVCVAAGLSAWQSRKARNEAARAGNEANRAAENSHPISNGWGTALREDMAATRQTVERMSEAQLLAERRELARDQQLHEVRTLLTAHLTDHAREVHL